LKEKVIHNTKYTTLIANNKPTSEHEELRIVYVGMTRPKKVLMIAVPNAECKAVWEKKLNENKLHESINR
jgi:ATP-dependent exoDNAse (exonuclease V) beta subunit